MNNKEEMKTINPSIFSSSYGNIRATYDDDGILFVAVDVARVFGFGSSIAVSYYKNPQKHRLEVWENDKLKTIVTATFIAPADCMQLYHFSKLRFEDRNAIKEIIFEEIIPSLSKAQPLPRKRDTEKTEAIIERLTRENRELEQRLNDVMDCCQRNCMKLHTKYCNRA